MQNVLEKVIQGAALNVQDVRYIEQIKFGQWVRQGDIYIHCVAKDHAHGQVTKNRQLAMGNTQGSRHILEGEAELFEGSKAPDWAPNAFLGPLIKLFKRGTVTHPEHAHIDLPAGTYQITHQMDARTLQRVKD